MDAYQVCGCALVLYIDLATAISNAYASLESFAVASTELPLIFTYAYYDPLPPSLPTSSTSKCTGQNFGLLVHARPC